MQEFYPSDYQAPFHPEDHLIQQTGSKPENSLELDVLFIGAGPASLSSAIYLAQALRKQGKELQIGIMEKATELGGHSLSGAVVNPCIFRELFPDKKEEELPLREKVRKESFYFLTKKQALPLPVPPGMKSKNYFTASLAEIVRWLGKEAEDLGVHIFTSHPASKLIMEGDQVVGATSSPFGKNQDGSKEPGFSEETYIYSKAVILGEGSRGHLTQAYLLKSGISSLYPQTYALGIKEVWKVKENPRKILHTIGWPLHTKTFGGSWLYPLGDSLISLGLVGGLDSPSSNLSLHDKFQEMKEHAFFAKFLQGGSAIEWGAKTLPEGGWHALPSRLHGKGILILGDAAGFINMGFS